VVECVVSVYCRHTIFHMRRAIFSHGRPWIVRSRCCLCGCSNVPLRFDRSGFLLPGSFHGPMVIAQPLPRAKHCNNMKQAPELDALRPTSDVLSAFRRAFACAFTCAVAQCPLRSC
jgi:hypothetical protein